MKNNNAIIAIEMTVCRGDRELAFTTLILFFIGRFYFFIIPVVINNFYMSGSSELCFLIHRTKGLGLKSHP